MNIRTIDCAGSHREIGLAIGRKFQFDIQQSLDKHPLLNSAFLPAISRPAGRLRFDRLVDRHRRRCPRYVDELEGIAEGAGVPFEKVFLINLRGEYQRYVEDGDDGGCSTGSLLSADAAAFGHNEDGLALYRDRAYLVRVRPEARPAFCAFCYPGFLPGNAFGFNGEGICFSANNVMPRRVLEGIGRHFIARSLLEVRSLAEAVAAVQPPDRASGFNYTIGSVRERRIVNVEVAPAAVKVTEINGPYFHTNHYVELSGIDQMVADSSRERHEQGLAFIRGGHLKSGADILKLLRDGEGRLPILRDGSSPDPFVTLVTALFDLDRKRLQIFEGRKVRVSGEPSLLAEQSLLF